MLDGDDKAAAERAVASICDAVAGSCALAEPGESPGATRARDATLAGGCAGLALLHGYSALCGDNARELQRCADQLERAIETIVSVPMGPELFGGVAGVGWAIEHLGAEVVDFGDEDPCRRIDELVLRTAEAQPFSGPYDLISGLVGLAVYALQRWPRDVAEQTLHAVLAHLERGATRSGGGMTWFTPPHHLPEHRRALDPDGHYDLGLAHGVAGIVAVLGHCIIHGVVPGRCEELLRSVVPWLLAQRLPAGAESAFAACVRDGRSPTACRLAWCYGDAGIGAALLTVAAATSDAEWHAAGLDVLRRAAHRSAASAGVKDATLCHGAAGLLHIFNRAYQATGDVVLRDGARRWGATVLALRSRHPAVAGFAAYQPRTGHPQWVDDPGFLGGAAGVGLALLGAVSTRAPHWDACLLTNIPKAVVP